MSIESESVSVVIVNYNGERFLPDCLGSLRVQTLKPAEIVVVDNASTDNSVGLIQSEYPEVKLDSAGENLYFCKGSNRGFAQTSSPYILLLNNDAYLDERYIEACLKSLTRDEKIGAVTGKVLRVDGETIDIAGQLLSRSRKPHDRGYGERDTGQFDMEEEVFGTGGVAPLFRRSMLDDIALDGQYFDEDFVQYYEDLDLLWRARNMGWKVIYSPEALAFHHRGGAGQSEPAERNWVRNYALANLPIKLQGHLLKNRYATMAKNDRIWSWLLGLPWILAYELKVFVYLLLIKPSLIPMYLRGFGFLKTAFRKRKQLKQMARERGIKHYGGRHRI